MLKDKEIALNTSRKNDQLKQKKYLEAELKKTGRKAQQRAESNREALKEIDAELAKLEEILRLDRKARQKDREKLMQDMGPDVEKIWEQKFKENQRIYYTKNSEQKRAIQSKAEDNQKRIQELLRYGGNGDENKSAIEQLRQQNRDLYDASKQKLKAEIQKQNITAAEKSNKIKQYNKNKAVRQRDVARARAETWAKSDEKYEDLDRQLNQKREKYGKLWKEQQTNQLRFDIWNNMYEIGQDDDFYKISAKTLSEINNLSVKEFVPFVIETLDRSMEPCIKFVETRRQRYSTKIELLQKQIADLEKEASTPSSREKKNEIDDKDAGMV